MKFRLKEMNKKYKGKVGARFIFNKLEDV